MRENQILTNDLIREGNQNRLGTKLKKYDKYIIGTSCFNAFESVIVPDISSDYIEYDPFSEFPFILNDFVKMIRLMDEKNIFVKGRNINKYKYIDILNAFTKEVMPFICKYGIFGTYYKNFVSVNKIDSTINDLKIFVNYSNNASEANYQNERYIRYVENFMDASTFSEMNVDENGLFLNKYIGDNVYLLFQDIYDIRNMMFLWNEYSKNKFRLDEKINKAALCYIDKEKYKYYERITNIEVVNSNWLYLLEKELTMPRINLVPCFEMGKLVMKWGNLSLYEIIKLMFLQNVVMKNKKIEICHYKRCQKVFQRRNTSQICCSKECNNTHRQQRYRDKIKVKEMIQQGIGLPEIALKMDVGLQYINDLLKVE